MLKKNNKKRFPQVFPEYNEVYKGCMPTLLLCGSSIIRNGPTDKELKYLKLRSSCYSDLFTIKASSLKALGQQEAKSQMVPGVLLPKLYLL